MRNRRRFAIAILLVAVVAAFCLPPVHWRVIGFVKGEAFYHGRPTSWWEREIREAYFPSVCMEHLGLKFYSGWERHLSPPWYDFLLPAHLRSATMEKGLLTNGDTSVLPLLLELLRSDDPKVRLLVVWGLDELRMASPAALPAIQAACDDSNEDVRFTACLARDGGLKYFPLPLGEKLTK